MTTEQLDTSGARWRSTSRFPSGLGRFRVNVFMQRGSPSMVMRYIAAEMPKLENLGLPRCSPTHEAQAGAGADGRRTGSGKSRRLPR